MSTVADGVILNISRMVNGNRSRRHSVSTRSLQNTALNPRVTGAPRSRRSAEASRGITSTADTQPSCVKIKGSREWMMSRGRNVEEHNTSKHNNPVRLLVFGSNLLVGDQGWLGLPLPEKMGTMLFQQRGDLLT